MKKIILIDIISALFILLFVYTATSKIIEHRSFQTVLSQSPMIGNKASVLSWALPMSELFAAVLLFFPAMRKFGFIFSFFLMLVFSSYIIYMILFSKNLPCSCGGVISQMTWYQHLIFNIFFTVLAAFALRITFRNKLFIAINRDSRTPV